MRMPAQMFTLLVLSLLGFPVSAKAATIEDVIRSLEALHRQVEAAETDEDAGAAVRSAMRVDRVGEQYPGLDRLAEDNRGLEKACTCCPSCTNDGHQDPYEEVKFPEYDCCVWPGAFTRRCVTGTGQIEGDVNLCCFCGENSCNFAFLLMPMVEPIGYAGSAIWWLLRTVGAAGRVSANKCSLMFPCWTSESEMIGTPPTKAEILKRIRGLIQKYRHIEFSPPPAYAGSQKRNESRDDDPENGSRNYGTINLPPVPFSVLSSHSR